MTKRIFFALCAVVGAILMVVSVFVSNTGPNASSDFIDHIFSPMSVVGMCLFFGGGLVTIFIGDRKATTHTVDRKTL